MWNRCYVAGAAERLSLRYNSGFTQECWSYSALLGATCQLAKLNSRACCLVQRVFKALYILHHPRSNEYLWAAVTTKNTSVVKPTNVLRTDVTKIQMITGVLVSEDLGGPPYFDRVGPRPQTTKTILPAPTRPPTTRTSHEEYEYNISLIMHLFSLMYGGLYMG